MQDHTRTDVGSDANGGITMEWLSNKRLDGVFDTAVVSAGEVHINGTWEDYHSDQKWLGNVEMHVAGCLVEEPMKIDG